MAKTGFRKKLSDCLELRYGFDISYSYNSLEKDNDNVDNSYDYYTKDSNYEFGIDLVLGLNYKIGSDFVFGAEILPDIKYFRNTLSYEYTSKIKKGLEFSFSNSPVLLSLVYRFSCFRQIGHLNLKFDIKC